MGVLYEVRTDHHIRRPHPSLCDPAARIFMKFDTGVSEKNCRGSASSMKTGTAQPILRAYRDTVWRFESKERPGSVTVCCVTAYAICILVDQVYIFTGTQEFTLGISV